MRSQIGQSSVKMAAAVQGVNLGGRVWHLRQCVLCHPDAQHPCKNQISRVHAPVKIQDDHSMRNERMEIELSVTFSVKKRTLSPFSCVPNTYSSGRRLPAC